jgi:hypothetical protein
MKFPFPNLTRWELFFMCAAFGLGFLAGRI